MKPLITALVDTYNHEQYIEHALVSVLEQGLAPSELEIIVVDDGSTDKTASIIQKFVPRVKHLRKKNGGQASAFNAGFSESQGQIVATLDGDDWWAKGKLATVVDALEQDPDLSAVSHAYYEFLEETKELRLVGPTDAISINLATPEAARDAFVNWKFLFIGALTVRRKLLERIMPIPERLVFSADSPIATASMAMGVKVVPQPLCYYRLHAKNLYGNPADDAFKLRRRYEMDDVMCGVLWPMLLRLGVSEECVSALLNPFWIWVNRHRLSTFGGSPLTTFRTEMRCFRSTYKDPSVAYRLFKVFVMGPATLLLPPRVFYKLRRWYGEQDLGRVRDQIFRTERANRNSVIK